LADALALDRFGIVAHDVGAYVAQAFARAHPARLAGLFFFDCPYPGIGRRWAEPDHLREIWYQSFHQLPWAAGLVGSSRATCERYLRHFLSHWAHGPDTFEEQDVEAWVDNFCEPGNLQGGFNWYIAANAARLEMIRSGPPALPPIEVPTRVRWGASDPIVKVEWADRLGEYFSDCDFAPVEDAGHFVAYEHPDLAVQEISEFFAERHR
jgi:pimeloyl-ACP methyl ester carboxylesterase